MTSSNPSPSAKPLDIAIVGETNLDLILSGLPERMPTERELLGSAFNLTLGGSSSILAHNLSLLGTSVGFTSQVGADEMGDIGVGLNEGGDRNVVTRDPLDKFGDAWSHRWSTQEPAHRPTKEQAGQEHDDDRKWRECIHG